MGILGSYEEAQTELLELQRAAFRKRLTEQGLLLRRLRQPPRDHRLQNPLIKEYTLNYYRSANKILRYVP